ncbi:hypothetical protein Pan153_18660 [Gimesia panareensis]|uniref:Uncharacterized protein n=1 Tax=Gimesia panareensis TaxID=2527978 RepID=A0A518FLJ5_9PLAN|nr:hypothetical protein [Gimesia panareensis]QDV17231.1 hypothetical protein Pan153_18660 [Gimesia panareensis]
MVKKTRRNARACFQKFDADYQNWSWKMLVPALPLVCLTIWLLGSVPYGGWLCVALWIVVGIIFAIYDEARFVRMLDEHDLYCVECHAPLVTKHPVRRGRYGPPHPLHRKTGEPPPHCPNCEIPIAKALGN